MGRIRDDQRELREVAGGLGGAKWGYWEVLGGSWEGPGGAWGVLGGPGRHRGPFGRPKGLRVSLGKSAGAIPGVRDPP